MPSDLTNLLPTRHSDSIFFEVRQHPYVIVLCLLVFYPTLLLIRNFKRAISPAILLFGISSEQTSVFGYFENATID